jgi:poly(A) polymerase
MRGAARGSMAQVRDIIESVSAIVEPVYLVGGSVRDALMGRECTDFDFSTPLGPDAIEQAVRAAGRRPYLMGKRFGTVAFRLEDLTIEVTSFRSENYREGSRRPSVEFLPDLEQDLSRRDFTVNAMALHGDELIDLSGGQADLEAGLVRAVGDPTARFSEDPLRMLRAARFVSQLDFEIDSRTRQAAAGLADRILFVARERWMIELDRLLVGPGVEAALSLLADTGLLRFLLPEIGLQTHIARDTQQGARSVFDLTVEAVGSAPTEITARWAALLRDAAVPYLDTPQVIAPDPAESRAGRESPGDRACRDRALLGAEIVERTALYLKWSNRRREAVKQLVAEDSAPREL